MTSHFLNDVANDSKIKPKIENYVIIASVKSKTMGRLKHRTGSRLLISSLPGSAMRMHVESLGMPRDVNKCSQNLA